MQAQETKRLYLKVHGVGVLIALEAGGPAVDGHQVIRQQHQNRFRITTLRSK